MKPIRFGITPKLTLIFVIFAVALLAGLNLLAYNNGRQALGSATESELLLALTEKQAALDGWVEDGQMDVVRFSRLPSAAAAAETLTGAAPGSAEARAAHDALTREMQAFVDPNVLVDLMLVDAATGLVLAATNPAEEGQSKAGQPFFIRGQSQPYVQNAYFSPETTNPAMTASAPLLAADGRLVAVVAGHMNLATVDAIIQRRTGQHETDEAFLINGSSLFVTQPRLAADPAVLLDGLDTQSSTACLIGGSGVLSTDDYRGVPALIAYRWLPERSLCLIAKIDLSEAQAPVQRFGLVLALFGALMLLTATGVAIWLARAATRPLLALQAAATRFGQGDLEARAPETSADEFGALAREFNLMAASLADQNTLQRQRLEQLYNLSADMIGVAGFDGFFKDLNPAWTRALGYAEHELLARPIIDLVHPDDQDAARHLAAPLTSSQPITALEIRCQCQDGGWRWLRWTTVADPQHQLIYAVVHDITDQRAAEDRLRASEAELRALFAAMPDLILTMSAEGRYLKIAPTGNNLLYRPADDLLGRTVTDILPPKQADQALEWIRQAVHLGQPVQAEYTLTIRGQDLWFAATIAPITPDSVVWVARDTTTQMRANAARQASEERYRALFEQASDGIFISNLSANFVDLNAAACEMLGYSRTELLGMALLDLFAPGELANQPPRLDDLRAGKALISQRSLIRKDGSLLPVEISAKLLPNGQLQGIVRDITERLEAARAVARERHILSASIAAMSDGLLVADLSGKFLVSNQAAERILGTDTSDAPVDQWSQKYGVFLADGETVCPTDDLPLVRALRGETSRDVEVVIRHAGQPEGVTILANGSPLTDETGAVWGGIVLFHDITDRKQSEAMLRESQERFKYIFDRSPIGISITLPSGVMRPNQAYCEMLGYTLDEMQNVNWRTLTHPDDVEESRQVAAALLAGEASSTSYTKRYLHKNGTVVWTDISTSLRRDVRGQPEYFLTAVSNITERVHTEELMLRQAEDLRRSNAELEQFAYVASHDLQEPLRMVSSYMQLLAERYQGQLDADADAFINFAVDGANRMKRLISDLLAYSRVGTRGQQFQSIELEHVLAETLDTLQLAIEAEPASVTHDPLPPVWADSGQMAQLFQNLVGNALQVSR